MPVEIPQLVAPGSAALVTQEIQRGVVGDLSPLPELAAQAAPILPRIAALCEAARSVALPVLHCTAERRADGQGANRNARIFGYMAKSEPKLLPGSAAAQIVPEVPVRESDLLLPRLHGLSPFQGTELDFVLRNMGVRNIIAVGVSVNVAITNLAFDAVNAGYQVVIPRDAVAGAPPEFVEMVFRHTLRNVATVCSSGEVLAAWGRG